MISFFEVIQKKSILLKLQLPQTIKIYKIFHPNLLQKALINLLTGQVNKPGLPIIINNKKKWEVENIFDVRNY